MPVVVKHKKVSEVPDSADETIIQPSDWNEEHEIEGITTSITLGGNDFDLLLTGFVQQQLPAEGEVKIPILTQHAGQFYMGASYRQFSSPTGDEAPDISSVVTTVLGGALGAGDPHGPYHAVNRKYLDDLGIGNSATLISNASSALGGSVSYFVGDEAESVAAGFPSVPGLTSSVVRTWLLFTAKTSGGNNNSAQLAILTHASGTGVLQHFNGQVFTRARRGTWQDWRMLALADNTIQSVNGHTGPDVTLTAADVVAVNKDSDTGIGGYTSAGHNLGNLSGTVTPSPFPTNFKYGTNVGAFTLAAPTTAGHYTIAILVTNAASGAGAITATGFSKIHGTFSDEANKKHLLTIEVFGSDKILTSREAN